MRGLSFEEGERRLSPDAVQAAADEGTRGGGGALPHLGAIQRSFGRHDVGAVRAHTDSGAADACAAMGAEAYASGGAVAFGGAPDLHTSAHEAAHVVQQRAGVSLTGGVGQSGDRYEQHADAVADRVVRGESAEGLLDAMAGGAGGLRGGVQKKEIKDARVDARAEETYYAKAAEFELKLGQRLATDPNANAGADTLLLKTQKMLDAYAEHTGRTKEEGYEQELNFAGGDKYYGAFTMTAKAVKKVFDNYKGAPLRTKLKIPYNAVRNNNLSKWLHAAAEEIVRAQAGDKRPVEVARSDSGIKTAGGGVDESKLKLETVKPGFAAAAGLDGVLSGPRLGEIHGSATKDKRKTSLSGDDVIVSGADTFSSALAWHSQTAGAGGDRIPNQNAGVRIEDQETVAHGDVPDLKAAEIKQIHKNKGATPGPGAGKALKADYKSRPGDKLPWEQGGEFFDVIPNSQTDKAAAEIHARLTAGLSGSTDLMLHAAQQVGAGDVATMEKLRLAMLGWMLPNNDHSFYEIMMSGECYGLPFERDPKRRGWEYEAPSNFRPTDPKSFQSILPENQFPSWFVSHEKKDTIGKSLPTPAASQGELAAEMTARGLSATVVGALDEDGLATTEVLWEAVTKSAFHDLSKGGDTTYLVRLNQMKLRDLRDSGSYLALCRRYPAHAEAILMALASRHHGGWVASFWDDELGRSQDKLGEVGADFGKQRAAMEAKGVPSGIVASLKDHQVTALVQLGGLVDNAPLGPDDPACEYQNWQVGQHLQNAPPYLTLKSAVGEVKAQIALGALLNDRVPGFDRLIMTMTHKPGDVAAKGVPRALLWEFRDPADTDQLDLLADDVAGKASAIKGSFGASEMPRLESQFAGLIGRIGKERFAQAVSALAVKHGGQA